MTPITSDIKLNYRPFQLGETHTSFHFLRLLSAVCCFSVQMKLKEKLLTSVHHHRGHGKLPLQTQYIHKETPADVSQAQRLTHTNQSFLFQLVND